jgi:hypothetical protein
VKKYETVIDVITEGDDRNDAAEKAGSFINGNMMENGMTISCGSTSLVRREIKNGGAFYGQCRKDKYLTRVYITDYAETDLEAAEKANDLFDIRTMAERSSVIWLFTHPISEFNYRNASLKFTESSPCLS